ncbi:hypothetical protein [Burkholderia ubonensis]|nr:hypothetical protein [Burkholderia ubonensis]
MTTTQSRGEHLASQLNLGDVLSWRLHWLVCDLQDLKAKTAASRFRSEPLRLGGAELTTLVDELTDITNQFGTLRWQTKTMLSLDYDDEVTPLLEHVPKYAEFCSELQETRAAIEQKLKAAAEAELGVVLSRIEAAAKIR